ncbi:MAG: N-acetylmuramoyl-L-alanine amidase [Planctomycetota bacterium]|jgi:tetratricopeptide (TPR) repeat protein
MLRSCAPIVVLLLALTACSSPLRESPGYGGRVGSTFDDLAGPSGTLESLIAAGRAREAFEQVELELGRTTDPAERARLEILAGRALFADGRHRSARLAYGRAERDLPQDQPDLLRQILHGRGNVAMALGEFDDAARSYREALDTGRGAARDHNDLEHALYLALREDGDASAESWKRDMAYFSNTRLSRLERELLFGGAPSAPASRPTLFAGGIPADPRAILSDIRRRAEWSARPIRGDYDPMKPITHATVHHSATPTFATAPSQAAAEVRGIQASHQAKWADIGYHFLIDRAGGIWEGRELRWQGAHEGAGLNQGAIGICLLGNFELGSPPSAQLDALRSLLDACSSRFGLTAMDVKTHREVRRDPTACPGRSLQSWVDGYRRQRGLASLSRQ